LERVESFIKANRWGPRDIVLVACERGPGLAAENAEPSGIPTFPVPCVGNLHTSVVEYLIRSGVGGVLIGSCPPRDCWSREGPGWLSERVFGDRAAELKDRVDKRRVRVVHAAEGEREVLTAAVREFFEHVLTLEAAEAEARIEIDIECEIPAVGVSGGAEA